MGVFAVVLDPTASNTTSTSSTATPQSDDEANEDIDGQIAQLSISHDGEYATAVCLAVESPMEGDVGGEAAARMVS